MGAVGRSIHTCSTDGTHQQRRCGLRGGLLCHTPPGERGGAATRDVRHRPTPTRTQREEKNTERKTKAGRSGAEEATAKSDMGGMRM